MARGRKNMRRRNRRSRKPLSFVPGSVVKVTFSGVIAAGGTVALNYLTSSGVQYSSRIARFQFSSDKISRVQSSIRLYEKSQQYAGPIVQTGPYRSSGTVRLPRGTDFWSGTGSAEHVAWISNLGSESVAYTAVVKIVSRVDVEVPTRSNVIDVLPSF